MSAFNFEVVSINEVPFGDVRTDTDIPPVVLVVDDERLLADSLTLILCRMGFAATAAYSAHAALSLAHAQTPAFLISDVYMPEMNGIELAMTVMSSFPACKVTLFSGHATEDELAQARAAGYDLPLLGKPVHPEKIAQHIRERLNVGSVFGGQLANRWKQ